MSSNGMRFVLMNKGLQRILARILGILAKIRKILARILRGVSLPVSVEGAG